MAANSLLAVARSKKAKPEHNEVDQLLAPVWAYPAIAAAVWPSAHSLPRSVCENYLNSGRLDCLF